MTGLLRFAHASFAQSVRRLLLPTTTESYIQKDEQYRAANVSRVRRLEENLETVEAMVSENREERSLILRSLKNRNESQEEAPSSARMQISAIVPRTRSFSSEDKTALVDEPLSIYEENSLEAALYRNIKQRTVFQTFARELEESIVRYQYLVHTQATADLTGYRELRDWAQGMLTTFEFLTTLLISISTVGAGLVYATIFSASRGNVEFMCLTFPLFTAGFLVPMTLLVLLKLAAKLPYSVRFGSQKIWSHIIGLFMAFAVVAVLAALVILNLTVFFLDPNATSPVNFDSYRISISGIAIFAFSSFVFLVAFAAFAVFFLVRRRVAVVRRERNVRASEASCALDNFRHV